MTDMADRHNMLAQQFVRKAGEETRSAAELMVVLESCQVAGMLLLKQLYGVPSQDISILMESSLHKATERFITSEMNLKKNR